jgi:F-type H+-transporting ATPase subunit delta
MKITEVSRRYARALMALAKQKGQHTRALEELQVIAKIFNTDANTHEYFVSPVVGPEQKKAVIQNTFNGKGLLDEVYNLLLLLAEKNRLNKFEEIVGGYEQQMDLEQNITRGSVTSAKVLTDADKKDLEGKIAKILNKKIILTYKEDPTLLGGVVAQAGGWTFDDSIETHLIKMNEELNRRVN